MQGIPRRRAFSQRSSWNHNLSKWIYRQRHLSDQYWDFKQAEQDVTRRGSLLEDTERYYNMALNLETTQRTNKATILSLRGKLYLRLLKLEESENDLQESLNLWNTLVDSPNLNLISAYHSLSTLLLRKCRHLFEKDKVNGMNFFNYLILFNLEFELLYTLFSVHFITLSPCFRFLKI